MEIVFETLGYLVLITILAGIFYAFYKILSQGFKAFTKNDD